jgi:alpha-amylase
MNNITLIQYFHWHILPEENLWKFATSEAGRLASLGITHAWLPPAFKSADGANEPGYAVYDLFDLGEFDQKGSVRTRYGTRDEYIECIKALHENGVQVLADIVFNHKQGGDEKEMVPVQQVDTQNRNLKIGEPTEKEGYTKYTFPGRKGKYSDYIWNWQSFTGFDSHENDDHAVYLILNNYGNEWKNVTGDEKENFDYLMGSDIEFRNPHVKDELKWWGKWYIETTGIDGFRFDAMKHIDPKFILEWLNYLKHEFGKDFFSIGEYWQNDVGELNHCIDSTDHQIHLLDVPLHFNFVDASLKGDEYDMRAIFDNSLIMVRPERSITFIDNHDTQPLQSLESPVDFWFKPHAYAITLLREAGIPCIFFPSLYGAKYGGHNNEGEEVQIEIIGVPDLHLMLKARKELAYGTQRDYFDHANTVGWTREGIDERQNSGLAVILTNGTEGHKTMELGKRNANKIFVDIYGSRKEKITTDIEGRAEFFVNDRSVSIWVREETLPLLQN